MLRAVAASMIVVALALAGVACITDVPLERLQDMSARTILATATVDAALAWFCALAAGPAWTLALAALRWLRRRRSALGRLWPLVVMGVGFPTSLLLTDAFYRPHTAPYVIGAAGFGLALAMVATITRPKIRDGLLLVIGGAALAADLLLPQAVSREVRDVIALLTATCALTALEPVRGRLMSADGRLLAAAIAVALVASTAAVYAADPLAPGWRPQAWEAGRWHPRLGRALRALVDVDGDGFSPVAWGGDCDDFDARRNPARHDHDGIDANCNGSVKPQHPSDADRGLAPPAGNPDEPADAIDRVVFITIDTFRADAFTPRVTPRLVALAQLGLDFTRLYSAASSTLGSLTLVLRGSDDAPPVGERLLRSGINTYALFGYHEQRLEATLFPGFAESHGPTEKELRWSARELTDRAIAHLSQLTAAGPRRELLWLHYFDAHYPVMPAPDLAPIAPPPGQPAEVGPYLTALATIDREIGRLQDWLVATHRWPRTLFIVTADHGESFGEHGIGYHGVGAYEAVTHVPGLMVGPGISPVRYTRVVSHRDLPASILGGFGLVARNPTVEEFGRSWIRLAAAPAAPLHLFVVTRSDRAESNVDRRSLPMAAIADDDWKLLVTFGIDLEQLYQPLKDPRERRDLLASHPEEAQRLDRQLALYGDIEGYP